MKEYQALSRYYDLFYDKETVGDEEFWRQTAEKAKDPILELGCGTGRVTFTLAAQGREITGMDNSEAMLARARTRLATQSPDVKGKVMLCKAFKEFPCGLILLFVYDTNIEYAVQGEIPLAKIAWRLILLFDSDFDALKKKKFDKLSVLTQPPNQEPLWICFEQKPQPSIGRIDLQSVLVPQLQVQQILPLIVGCT